MTLGYTRVSTSEFFCEMCGIEFPDLKSAAQHCAGYCPTCETANKDTIQQSLDDGSNTNAHVRYHVEQFDTIQSYYQPMIIDEKLWFVDLKTFRRYPEEAYYQWVNTELDKQYQEWFGAPSTWDPPATIIKMTSESFDRLRLKTQQLSNM